MRPSAEDLYEGGVAFRVHLPVPPCDDAALLVGRVERGPDDPAIPETAAFRPLETAADVKRRKTAAPDEAPAVGSARGPRACRSRRNNAPPPPPRQPASDEGG